MRARSIEEVAGKWPRTPIRAGSAILAGNLELPKEVVRGETVHVAVRNGGAYLEMEALAEGSGAAGETITVRNVTSQKHFPARVSGKGTVSVDASAGRRN